MNAYINILFALQKEENEENQKKKKMNRNAGKKLA